MYVDQQQSEIVSAAQAMSIPCPIIQLYLGKVGLRGIQIAN